MPRAARLRTGKIALCGLERVSSRPAGGSTSEMTMAFPNPVLGM